MLIDWFTVAAQVINFLVLVWLLKRFLYKPVLDAIDAREKRIETQLRDAVDKKADAAKEQAEFQHKNEEFDQQRVALLAEATNTAKTERERLLTDARKDAEALRAKLKKANDDELDNVNRKLEALSQSEVFSIARKTLADLAGTELEGRITDVFIRRLHDLNDKERNELKSDLGGTTTPVRICSAFDLSPPQKTTIEQAIKSLLNGGESIEFETKAGLISGIELTANGRRIAWSIGD